MSITCKECGKAVEQRYIPKTQKEMNRLSLCFTCLFWTEKLQYVNHPHVARIDGTQYVIGEEHQKYAPRGFGGLRFDIQFHDGRKVTTNNLWCNGDIPEHFRARLPDNAVFLRENT